MPTPDKHSFDDGSIELRASWHFFSQQTKKSNSRDGKNSVLSLQRDGIWVWQKLSFEFAKGWYLGVAKLSFEFAKGRRRSMYKNDGQLENANEGHRLLHSVGKNSCVCNVNPPNPESLEELHDAVIIVICWLLPNPKIFHQDINLIINLPRQKLQDVLQPL